MCRDYIKGILTVFLAAVLSFSGAVSVEAFPDRDCRRAVRLYEKGAFAAAKAEFGRLLDGSAERDREMLAAYYVLSSIRSGSGMAEAEVSAFKRDFPYSESVHLMTFYLASNHFDRHGYGECIRLLESLEPESLPAGERDECDFMLAYSYLMEGYFSEAEGMFSSLAGYGRVRLGRLYAPVCYSLGWLHYRGGDFSTAAGFFGESVGDMRFKALSSYYLLECNFMLKDYRAVAAAADKDFAMLEGDYMKNAARMISEAYMVLGKSKEAAEFYERFSESEEDFGREDYYFAGMVAYGLAKYDDAVRDFSMVVSVRDSIAQSAFYYQGYSYIQSGNKLAAMGSFGQAAGMDFDKAVKEDAMFNHAKLLFDVNEDMSGFTAYLDEYSSSSKSDEIYSYIASAYAADKDYSSAIDAYMKIGDLTVSAREGFRKALFLRSMQLVSSGSYSKTIPLLERVSALSGGDRLAFLADYWLAEAYYRNDRFDKAADINSRLLSDGAYAYTKEYGMLEYNLAYDYFKMEDYVSAEKHFRRFLGSSPSFNRREASLRLADCLFMQGDYPGAAEAYEHCADSFYDKTDIYPLYQSAVSYGLVPMDAKKIAMLERVGEYSPDVKYYDYAMFELGRAYVKIDDDEKAEEVFLGLKDRSSDSTVIAASMIELGSLYRNRLEYSKALGCYKQVVSQMPSSIYSQDALAAIEAIYTASNNPQGYLAYIDSIGKSYLKSEDEKEDMIFAAAEQLFLKGDYQAALVSLNSYLKQYPSGARRSQAYFYIAESQKSLERYEKALDAYYKVMQIGEGAFAESATLNYAEISYRLERYMQAYEGFSTLEGIAVSDNNRYTALLGVMRSQYRLKNHAGAIAAADNLAASPYCDESALTELTYVKAKSYIALSDREHAAPLLDALAEHPQTPEGAEAAYIIIQETYDSGKFAEVEPLVYDLAGRAGGQTYFLARAFIVLGDSFAERDEWEQARATFESILDNYRPSGEDDDIRQQVEMRLDKMEEMGLFEN